MDGRMEFWPTNEPQYLDLKVTKVNCWTKPLPYKITPVGFVHIMNKPGQVVFTFPVQLCLELNVKYNRGLLNILIKGNKIRNIFGNKCEKFWATQELWKMRCDKSGKWGRRTREILGTHSWENRWRGGWEGWRREGWDWNVGDSAKHSSSFLLRDTKESTCVRCSSASISSTLLFSPCLTCRRERARALLWFRTWLPYVLRSHRQFHVELGVK